MALPTDHDTLCRWRCFAIKWWLMDINIQFGCFHAMMLGMPMRRSDFLRIIRVYIDYKDSETCNGPCDPDFDLREWQ
jgi:hypothetical protein